MSIVFAPATRAATKARIALCGPSGSGKTYTGLALACSLSDSVGVIDTERGSASKYKGLNGWEFSSFAPQSFSPASLVEALGVAAGNEFGCVLIDSWSHYWMGTDGMLEQVDRKSRNGNSFGGWKEMRPDERRMIDAIVSYPGHVIATLRVKTEYVIEKDERGKSVPRKVGLKPEQRDGIEYEFDLVGDLDHSNVLTVSKSRIPSLSHAVIPQPGPDLADKVREWLEDGVSRPGPREYRADALKLDDATLLRQLWEEVVAVGLRNAPVLDENDQPTTLGELIVARGRAVNSGGAS